MLSGEAYFFSNIFDALLVESAEAEPMDKDDFLYLFNTQHTNKTTKLIILVRSRNKLDIGISMRKP
jgi:hypothetical protein